jgi:hypothetical protein
MAKWHGINFGDRIRGNSNILKGVALNGSTLRFTKGDDTTEDVSLSSGGGLTETPLANISGRWTWSSSDDGERVFTGNSVYGIFNFYNHSTEPSDSTLRSYSSSHVVDSTTANGDDAYEMSAFGVWCPNNGKKVKAKISFRTDNAPNGSTWGLSLWSTPDPTSGTVNTGTDPTLTLRAVSPDITATNNDFTYWTTEVTTTSVINDNWVLPLMENRTGALSTTTYIIGQIALFLVD